MHLADPRLLRTNCYLDGRWEAADDGRTFPVTDPADGRMIAEVPLMAAAETSTRDQRGGGRPCRPGRRGRRRSARPCCAAGTN
jgi:hypothetical protein